MKPWTRAVESGKADPADLFACEVEETDVAVVQRFRITDGPDLVGFSVGSTDEADDSITSVFLTPANARRAAAALLNAADAADGTTPLVFLPRQPDEPKPRP